MDQPLTLIPRPSAEDDLLDIYAYIHAEQPAAAERFFTQARLTMNSLCEFPESGRLFDPDDPELADIRTVKLKGFQVSVYYRVDGRVIDVIAALHGSRDIGTTLRKPQ